MSKPTNEMTNPSTPFDKTLRTRLRGPQDETKLRTREELIYALGDILERDTDDWGRCRWCRAEEKPVNLAGEAVAPEDACEYRMEHEADCAATYIAAVLNGTYEYVNEPPKAQDAAL